MRKGLSELLGAMIITIITLSLAATYMQVVNTANKKLIEQIEQKEQKLEVLGASIIIQAYPSNTGKLNITIISQIALSPQDIIVLDKTSGATRIIETRNLSITPDQQDRITIDYNYTCQPIKIMIIDESGAVISRDYTYQDCIDSLATTTQYYDPITKTLSRIITYTGQPTSTILVNQSLDISLSLVTPGFSITNSSMTFDVYRENAYLGRITIGQEIQVLDVNGTTAYIGVTTYKDLSLLYIRLGSNHTITRFLGELNASMNLKAVYSGVSFRPYGGLKDTTLIIPYASQVSGSIYYKFTRKIVSGSLTYTYIYINNNASITFTADNILLLAYASQDKPLGGQIDLNIRIREITGIDPPLQTTYLGRINGQTIIKTAITKPFPEDPPTKAYTGLLEKFQKINLNLEVKTNNTLRGTWNLAVKNQVALTTSTPIDLYLTLSIPPQLYLNTSYYLETTTNSTLNTDTIEIVGTIKPQQLPLPWSIPITIIVDNENQNITLTITREPSNIHITNTTPTPKATVFPLDTIRAYTIHAIRLNLTTLQYPITILYNGTTIYTKNTQTTVQELQATLQSNTAIIYTGEESRAPIIILING